MLTYGCVRSHGKTLQPYKGKVCSALFILLLENASTHPHTRTYTHTHNNICIQCEEVNINFIVITGCINITIILS